MNQLDGWDVSTLDYLGCGSALVELKDPALYNRFRMEAIERFTGTANPVAAERIVKISLLYPADDVVLSALQPLVNFAGRNFQTMQPRTYEDAFRAAWAGVSMALFEYRTGNFHSAEEWCVKVLGCPDRNDVRNATARTLLAMVHHKREKETLAQKELRQAAAIIDARFEAPLDNGGRDEGFWFDWLFARDLLREAQQMMQPPQSTTAQAFIP